MTQHVRVVHAAHRARVHAIRIRHGAPRVLPRIVQPDPTLQMLARDRRSPPENNPSSRASCARAAAAPCPRSTRSARDTAPRSRAPGRPPRAGGTACRARPAPVNRVRGSSTCRHSASASHVTLFRRSRSGALRHLQRLAEIHPRFEHLPPVRGRFRQSISKSSSSRVKNPAASSCADCRIACSPASPRYSTAFSVLTLPL